MIEPINNLFDNNEFRFQLEKKFDHLNKLINGVGLTDNIIVAGRPGNCSNALIRNLGIEISKTANLLYISPSFSKRNIFESLNKITISNEENSTDNSHLKKTKLQQNILKLHNLFFLDNINFYDEIVQKIRTFTADHNNPFIIIESLNDIINNKFVDNQALPLKYIEILSSFKKLSSEENVPIIFHLSLTADISNSASFEPKLQDISFMGSAVSLIDKIIFTYRPRYYRQTFSNNHEFNKDIVDLIVPVNKDGKTGCISMSFNSDNLEFNSLM